TDPLTSDTWSGNVGRIGGGNQAGRQVRMATSGPYRIDLHQGPGALVGDQRGKDRIVELVAATDRAIGTQERQACQREIADGIERLMADELVHVARALRVEHPCIADHDRVLKRGTERIAGAPELAHIPHETERTRTCDVAPERVGGAIECNLLTPD